MLRFFIRFGFVYGFTREVDVKFWGVLVQKPSLIMDLRVSLSFWSCVSLLEVRAC